MVRGQERVVALADMDCFYIQVERRLDPRLYGKPCVVVQYKTWKGGGIIAVSYEARAFGVKRNMWAADAKKLCPDLQLARVPESRGKADLTRYREASIEVMEVMSRFAVIERASIDEAYLDLTQTIQERLQKMKDQPISVEQLRTTYIQGFPNSLEEENMDNKEEIRQHGVCQWLKSLPFGDPSNPELQLTVGAMIMEEMRAAVESVTGFQCSVGISHNKVLAKLACGLNKPNRQTLVSQGAVPQLFSKMPISSIRNLGGKLGASITEYLGVQYMGELVQFSESQLHTHFGEKTGQVPFLKFWIPCIFFLCLYQWWRTYGTHARWGTWCPFLDTCALLFGYVFTGKSHFSSPFLNKTSLRSERAVFSFELYQI